MCSLCSVCGSCQASLINSSLAQKTVPSDCGIPIHIRLLPDAKPQLSRPLQVKEVSIHFAPYSQMKLSLADGQMEESAHTVSITASFSGRLTTPTKVALQLFAWLRAVNLSALAAWRARSAFGKSAQENLSRILRSTRAESLRFSSSLTTNTCSHVRETRQSYAGTLRQRSVYLHKHSAWVESMHSQ